MRAQERVVFLNVTVSNNNVTGVTVSNFGSETIQIRGFYVNTLFACDPSDTALNSDGAFINPKENKTIVVKEFPFNRSDYLSVATSRGIKSMVLVANLWPISSSSEPVETNYGPLRLNFTLFFVQTVNKNGNAPGAWVSGAIVPPSYTYCSWNITVTNIDTRDITINRYSSLDLVSNAGGAQNPWYLRSPTQTIGANQTVNIIYTWDGPQSGNAQQMANLVTAKVFLTFYGQFSDGLTFGQTIPFEAIRVG